jgi:hypothetical protein
MYTPAEILKTISFYRNPQSYGTRRLSLPTPPSYSGGPAKNRRRYLVCGPLRMACDDNALTYRRLLYNLFRDRFADVLESDSDFTHENVSSTYLTDYDIFALRRWVGEAEKNEQNKKWYSVRHNELRREIAELFLFWGFDLKPQKVYADNENESVSDMGMVDQALELGGVLTTRPLHDWIEKE